MLDKIFDRDTEFVQEFVVKWAGWQDKDVTRLGFNDIRVAVQVHVLAAHHCTARAYKRGDRWSRWRMLGGYHCGHRPLKLACRSVDSMEVAIDGRHEDGVE